MSRRSRLIALGAALVLVIAGLVVVRQTTWVDCRSVPVRSGPDWGFAAGADGLALLSDEEQDAIRAVEALPGVGEFRGAIDLQGYVDITPGLGSDDFVFDVGTAFTAEDKQRLTRVDLSTGEVAWRIAGQGTMGRPYLLGDDNLLTYSDIDDAKYRVAVRDAETARVSACIDIAHDESWETRELRMTVSDNGDRMVLAYRGPERPHHGVDLQLLTLPDLDTVWSRTIPGTGNLVMKNGNVATFLSGDDPSGLDLWQFFDEGERNSIEMISGDTGETLWVWPTAQADTDMATAAAVVRGPSRDDVLVVQTDQDPRWADKESDEDRIDGFAGLDPETGETLWEFSVEFLDEARIRASQLIVIGHNDLVQSYDIKTGELLWTRQKALNSADPSLSREWPTDANLWLSAVLTERVAIVHGARDEATKTRGQGLFTFDLETGEMLGWTGGMHPIDLQEFWVTEDAFIIQPGGGMLNDYESDYAWIFDLEESAPGGSAVPLR